MYFLQNTGMFVISESHAAWVYINGKNSLNILLLCQVIFFVVSVDKDLVKFSENAILGVIYLPPDS